MSTLQQKDIAIANYQRDIPEQRQIIEDLKNQRNELNFRNFQLSNQLRVLQGEVQAA